MSRVPPCDQLDRSEDVRFVRRLSTLQVRMRRLFGFTPDGRKMKTPRDRALADAYEAYPEYEGQYVTDQPGYAHAGVDNGGTKMIEVRHPTHALEAVHAALAVLADGPLPETLNPRAQLDRLKTRLAGLAGSWGEPRETGGIAERLTPEACAVELLAALEEPL